MKSVHGIRGLAQSKVIGDELTKGREVRENAEPRKRMCKFPKAVKCMTSFKK